MEIREIECKTALSHSGLSELDYSLNPYRGCAHACLYCYAPAMTYEERRWGSFVDVKINVAQVLEQETKTKKRGVVGLGTVTDAYQPLEEKYKITRACLEVLAKRHWPVCIQTKSALVLRDIDILQKMDCEVGLTITAIDDSVRMAFEPGASSAGDRLSALEKLAAAGIRTFAFIGPILPYLTDKNADLEKLISSLADAKVGYVMADRFRVKPGLMECVEPVLRENYPQFADKWKAALKPESKYFDSVISEIGRLCAKYKIPFLDKHPFKIVETDSKQATLF
ncbi:MAG: radical SAM protein [Candidatus Thermoplasmatota archaeon]|nr:radical SAM protein [Candidatus Thermoplasmatota archaeon]